MYIFVIFSFCIIIIARFRPTAQECQTGTLGETITADDMDVYSGVYSGVCSGTQQLQVRPRIGCAPPPSSDT
ncbi:hypothetical protein LIA77_08592 [Sarocladium implicatum]|nr:hypothetical protein LIA77_08592 [Sarocladium implicatum]